MQVFRIIWMFIGDGPNLRDGAGCGNFERSRSLYYAHAYKNAGAAADQLDFPTVVQGAPNGNPTMSTLRTRTFGPRRAPSKWARATTSIQFALRMVFGVWLGIFYGDCYFDEPQCAVDAPLWVAREISPC